MRGVVPILCSYIVTAQTIYMLCTGRKRTLDLCQHSLKLRLIFALARNGQMGIVLEEVW
jgi:hypothetical protein